MTSHMEDMLSASSTCVDHCNQSLVEPLVSYCIHITAGTKFKADIFHLYGKSFLDLAFFK